jgi:carbon monoxide dehydrogenase subunit G
VKIGGSYQLPLAPADSYAALQDPALLAQCMPGCEKLERLGPDEYAMRMKMMLAAVSGLFDGKIRITNPRPPEAFTLIVEGQGKIGFMKGEGAIELKPAETGTEIVYDGDVQVGGTIAAVGSRLVDTTAKMMIKRFFDKFASLVANGYVPGSQTNPGNSATAR